MDETECLKQLLPNLVANLKADSIIEHLYQKNLLTASEYDDFVKDISQKSAREVNRGILLAVKKGRKGSVTKFTEILGTSQPELAYELQRGKSAVIIISDQVLLPPWQMLLQQQRLLATIFHLLHSCCSPQWNYHYSSPKAGR